ncbi:MAG: STAS domain-containing protein [Lachnospiraceae bacterium]|nr:STAS domain-containing protein [Lachnospiraceae bacterium]
MNIQEIPGEDMLTLKIEGKVDSYTGDEFSEHVIDACRKGIKVRLDLTDVPYFSSAGLRGFIMGYKVSKVSGGALELYGVNDVLLKTLQDTGLDQSLTIITLKDLNSVSADCASDGSKGSPGAYVETGGTAYSSDGAGTKRHDSNVENSPSWVLSLPETDKTDQLLIVAVYEKSSAWISLHEKDDTGRWGMVLTTPGFIGKGGLGGSMESMKTASGAYPFNRFLLTYLDDRKPFTDGRIAIPEDKLTAVFSRISDGCIMVVDTLTALGGNF